MSTVLDNWIASALLVAVSAAVASYLLLTTSLPPIPARGLRGFRRAHMRQGGGFRAVEPLIRLAAARVSGLPLAGLRARLELQLSRGGDRFGITADELIGIGVLCGLGAAVALFCGVIPLEGLLLRTVLISLASGFPLWQVRRSVHARQKEVERTLPAAIDLASMGMGAGLDFPGALAQVTAHWPSGLVALREELERILQELSLGRSRSLALQGFADRVPTQAVREFVAAVRQSEERGTPLARVLRIQAGGLRRHRTVRAEEAAARAGVLMMLPMMMLFGSVLLLLLGPLVMEISAGGM